MADLSLLPMKFNPAFLDEETLVRSFVVRKPEFETVVEMVRENTGAVNQHVLIIGPRGIGKTTLVHRVAAEVRRDPALAACWYPVVYGEESYGVMNAGEFWLEALFQIAEQTADPRWQAAHDDLSGERNPERLEQRTLAQLMDFADDRGRRLLLVVENLNMLVGDQMSDDEAWRVRHTLLNEPRLMLLGTATRRFEGIDNEGKALYDLFRIVDLQPLDSLDDIGAVWALATNETPRRAYLRPVEILTGGNPRLIRILSEFAARTSFRELMENLVHLVDDHTEYFKHHLDALPPQERKVFVALADRWDPGTARDIADMTRLGVNQVSALLARLESRGAVTVRKQRGRTKVYQVAERLYNIYHLMRRRGQASARVRAAVRFMVQMYEGEAIVPIVGRLIDEACDLTPEQRREHYIAYAEVLDLAEPKLRSRIVAETHARFEALPDVPSDLRERLEAERPDPYAEATLEELMQVDTEAISSERELRCLLNAFIARVPLNSAVPALQEVLRVIEHLNRLAPDDAWAWGIRGITLDNLSRHEEALEAFDRALALDPNGAWSWRHRGVLLSDLDRHEEALEAFDRALALDPGSALTWSVRGITLDNLGRPEEALEAFDRVLALDRKDALAWSIRGATLRSLGRSEEALESLDRALALDPSSAPTWIIRGATLRSLGRREEALEALDRVVAIEPNNALGWCVRGALLYQIKHHAEALDSFDRAFTLDPSDPLIRLSRGEALSAVGRSQEALDDLSVALQSLTGPESLSALTDFIVSLAAHDRTASVLQLLLHSPVADAVEPLIVALRMDLGEEVEVAQEIEEVARDLLKRIEAARGKSKGE